MQHRYTGDIGDFAKLGLLRALGEGKRLGVAWYLYPDEDHNGDGRHISYLDDPAKWRHLDTKLYDSLRTIVQDNGRSVYELERSGLLKNAIFSGKLLDFNGSSSVRKLHRIQWLESIRNDLNDCELIFTDPDNGLCEDSKYKAGQRKYWKRQPLSDVNTLVKGRTGIHYHHNAMFPGGHHKEIQYWLSRLGDDAMALYWRPYSPRTFFIVNPTNEIKERIERFMEKWSPHFQLHSYKGKLVYKPKLKASGSGKLTGIAERKVCPECGHQFMGEGWGGIDAHWKSKHEHLMPYKEAWQLIKSGAWQCP